MRILTFSTLFPNSERPGHGIFVEQRLRKLVASGRIESQVLAPVPWVPFEWSLFPEYSVHARVPPSAVRNGLSVVHPRFPVIPKVGMTMAPWLMFLSVLPVVRSMIRDGNDFDLIDAHYFYPDGVAASWIGRAIGKPVVITARGTDINLIPRFALPRHMILAAAKRAAALITVSQALKDRLIELGVSAQKVTVLRNGVDLEKFRPMDRTQLRNQRKWSGRWLVSVGHLIERKGHHLLIEALPQLPDCSLAIVGDGPMKSQLAALAVKLDVSDRVQFLGAVDQEELPGIYNAADALVLGSSREGMANVLLEAIGCGLPVVATPIWGTPEVIAAPEAGLLTKDRSACAFVDAVGRLFSQYPDRARTRVYAEQFSWDATTAGQLAVFESVLSR